MKKIGKVSPYLFGDHLVIALSKDWINVYNSVPEFVVLIDNGRLILQSQMIRQTKGDYNSC